MRPRPRGRSGRVTTSSGRCGRGRQRGRGPPRRSRTCRERRCASAATTTTCRMRGPCTPSTRSSSMSEVADGPETNVTARRARTAGSSRATASGTIPTTCSPSTTQTCRSGTSVSARRPWAGPPSSTKVPVSAIATAQPVRAPSSPSSSAGVRPPSSTSSTRPRGTPRGRQVGRDRRAGVPRRRRRSPPPWRRWRARSMRRTVALYSATRSANRSTVSERSRVVRRCGRRAAARGVPGSVQRRVMRASTAARAVAAAGGRARFRLACGAARLLRALRLPRYPRST